MTRTSKTVTKAQGQPSAPPVAKRAARKLQVQAAPATPAVPPQSTATPDAPPPQAAPSTRPAGKLGQLIGLLEREAGATLDEMTQVTGWQAHSVRGAMSGALKKKLGLTLTSQKSEQGRTYRILVAEPVA